MDPFMFWGLPFLARKNVFRQMNPNDVEGESLENLSLRNVNRIPILMSQDPDNDFLVCEKDKKRTFDEKMEVMKMISKHLLDIVNVESYDLRYSYHHDLPMKKFTKCFVFDITRKFGKVEINNWCEKLKAPEFDFLMNEIEVDKMNMSVNARVKGVFTHPKIVFYQHSTVSFDNIFNLKSEKFEAQMHRLIKPEELIRLLVAWADGEKLQNLKWMRIFFGLGSYKKNFIGRVTKRMQEMEGEVSFEILEIEQEDNDEEDHEDQDEDQEVEEDGADEQDEEMSDEEPDDEPEQEDVEMSDDEVSNGEDVEEKEGMEQKQKPEIVARIDVVEIGQDDLEEIADEQKSCDIEAEEEQDGVDENDGVAGSDENNDEDHDEDDPASDKEDEEQDGDQDDEDDKASDSESNSEEEEESDEEDNEDNEDISEIRLQRKIDGKVLRLLMDHTSFEVEVFSENDFFFNDLLES
ncbi:hypothetical protein CAEBREN_05693 [Caenorhabditis brenneri]|uniref:F-box associated domain-containing protein n=1 Tax=Caenorhabditis brenneri TaxID=135651 RepID=G0N2F2_CAEBE|nr:hypothetical protein CAEBREN_05693 [Caenorhabditis brenneri]